MKILVVGGKEEFKQDFICSLAKETGLKKVNCKTALEDYERDDNLKPAEWDDFVNTSMENYLLRFAGNDMILDGYPATVWQYKYMREYIFDVDLVIVLYPIEYLNDEEYQIIHNYRRDDEKTVVWEFKTRKSLENIVDVVSQYVHYIMS